MPTIDVSTVLTIKWWKVYLGELVHSFLMQLSSLGIRHQVLHIFRLQGPEHHETCLTLKQPDKKHTLKTVHYNSSILLTDYTSKIFMSCSNTLWHRWLSFIYLLMFPHSSSDVLHSRVQEVHTEHLQTQHKRTNYNPLTAFIFTFSSARLDTTMTGHLFEV